jgi:UDP-N-acetylmuramoyl-tripeptide--D-alanyl-D-alanine ligase
LHGDPDLALSGFSIDTRTLARGDLFFAIPGERFDGHAFVPAALARGAGGVLVGAWPEESAPPERDAVVVLVDDTIRALQALGRYVRRRSDAWVVAITGSAGKTTTKEVAADLLGARYRVFRNRGNLNNHLGLPLSLLDLRHAPEVAVVELGMNHAGEIRRLVSIAEPEVRVWTNVSEVHAEFFASVEAIADAKAEILEAASPSSLLVANANDPRVMARVARFPGTIVTFGVETQAHIGAWSVEDLGLAGTRALVRWPEGERRLEIPLLGRGNLANVLAAMGVAREFGITFDEVAERVAGLRPAPHRGEIVRLARGVVVVDDAYNSNPQALERALDVVRHEMSGARRVAVVGEMLELGERASELHERCGRTAAAAGLAALVTIGGPAVRALGAAAVAAGLPAGAVAHAETSEEAADLVARLVRPGDLVLVKASRGVKAEFVVERLKAEFA